MSYYVKFTNQIDEDICLNTIEITEFTEQTYGKNVAYLTDYSPSSGYSNNNCLKTYFNTLDKSVRVDITLDNPIVSLNNGIINRYEISQSINRLDENKLHRGNSSNIETTVSNVDIQVGSAEKQIQLCKSAPTEILSWKLHNVKRS